MSNPQQFKDQPAQEQVEETGPQITDEVTELETDVLEQVSGGGNGTILGLS